MRRILIATLSLVSLAGCDLDLDFTSEATSITASAVDSDLTRVTICPGPSALLSCNDSLDFSVAVGSDVHTATEGPLSFGLLEADFATTAADTLVTVTRTSDNASASTTLPAPFTPTGPTSPTVFARGLDVHLIWDADGSDPMSWKSDILCGGSDYIGQPVAIDDTGALTVSTSDLPDGHGDSCTASITLTRTRTGALSAAYISGSTIVSTQTRSIGFKIEP